MRASEGIMGAQPMVPAGRVRESLVIAATFVPLVLFHLLSQRDVQLKYYFFFFFQKDAINFKKNFFCKNTLKR